MLRVGLTGSIAVGKSFVSSVLAGLGCHVLDADATARDVVTKGSPGIAKIVESFGAAVLQADGTLDRTKLGVIVFGDEEKRKLLNSILHPYIMVMQDEKLRDWEVVDPSGIGVVDAALMIESGGYRRFDKIIVVHCQPAIQLNRLMSRGGFTLDEAQARISAQMPQEEKMQYADFLIDSSCDKAGTRKQTEEVYRALRSLCDQQPAVTGF